MNLRFDGDKDRDPRSKNLHLFIRFPSSFAEFNSRLKIQASSAGVSQYRIDVLTLGLDQQEE
ncbi:hypothetical protein VNI00_014126, partial [Paramarasmius palmivorus]